MTSHVERDPPSAENCLGALKSVHFSCDEPDCDVVAYDKDIPVVGGLIGLGWDCRGGRHLCPKHKVSDTKEKK